MLEDRRQYIYGADDVSLPWLEDGSYAVCVCVCSPYFGRLPFPSPLTFVTLSTAQCMMHAYTVKYSTWEMMRYSQFSGNLYGFRTSWSGCRGLVLLAPFQTLFRCRRKPGHKNEIWLKVTLLHVKNIPNTMQSLEILPQNLKCTTVICKFLQHT